MYINIIGIPTAIVAQTISNADLHNGGSVCPDKEITLNCTVRGSSGIEWRSQEYIGGTGQLLITALFYEIGYNVSSSSTVATLTEKYSTDNGEQVLESTLSIVPSLNHLNSSVTCVHTDSGTTDQFIVQVVGKSCNDN